jgi:BlaI family penicillinase repressor
MRKRPRISEAEWDVMRVVWDKGRCTAQQVVEELAHRDWSHRTVKTLLGRLKAKRALTFEADGLTYIYRAAVRRPDCVRQESEAFLDRVFGGEVASLLAHFLKTARLTRSETADLKKRLSAKK